MTVSVVAEARSNAGGELSCGCIARPGDVIHKITTDGQPGHSTRHRNGPGRWVCLSHSPVCSTEVEDAT